MAKIKKTPKEIWDEYQKGREYKSAIDLYDTVKMNENFFIGNQWEGVNAPDLPKPTLNILRRVVAFMCATLVSDDIAISFEAHDEDDDGKKLTAAAMGTMINRVMEFTRFRHKLRSCIRNAAVDGDMCLYVRFDENVETGQTVKGDIRCEIIENINVMFGNPYTPEIEGQPYIIIAQRKTVEELKDEAEVNGISESDRLLITADSDEEQMEKGDSDTLATKLIKFWMEDGQLWVSETVRDVAISKPKATPLTMYPLCWATWEDVKSSCHGQAAITGVIPNQIEINRIVACIVRSVHMNAFPKTIIDGKKIKSWSEKPGVVIKSENLGVNRIQDAVTSIKGGDVSPQAMELVSTLINLTRDFLGANDSVLGNINPDNAAAIIATQQSATMPLQLQKLKMYQFVEDFARICVDIMHGYYGEREVYLDDPVEVKATDITGVPVLDGAGKPVMQEIKKTLVDFRKYDAMNYHLNVDVGESSYFSELMQQQTMDNLLSQGLIADLVTYLESVPRKYVRNKGKLVSDLKKQQEQMASMSVPAVEPPDLESQVQAVREQLIGG